jgi:hypothetical protein
LRSLVANFVTNLIDQETLGIDLREEALKNIIKKTDKKNGRS